MLRLPTNKNQYSRSYSAHLQSVQKTQTSQRKVVFHRSSNSSFFRNSRSKKQAQSLFGYKLVFKPKNDEMLHKIEPTPSSYALYEKKLIPPSGKNYQYFINKSDIPELADSKNLIEPSQLLVNALKLRSYTPTPSKQNLQFYEKYENDLRLVERKHSARRNIHRNNFKTGKNKKPDIVIDPWQIGDDGVDYIYIKK